MILTDERRYKFLCPLLLQMVMISPCVSSPNCRDPHAHTHTHTHTHIWRRKLQSALPLLLRPFRESITKAIEKRNDSSVPTLRILQLSLILPRLTTRQGRGLGGGGQRASCRLSWDEDAWRFMKNRAFNLVTKTAWYVDCFFRFFAVPIILQHGGPFTRGADKSLARTRKETSSEACQGRARFQQHGDASCH